MPKFVKSENIQTGVLPQGRVVSSVLSNEDGTPNDNGNWLFVVSAFPLDYPEEAVQNRLGKVPKDEKGNPTGEPRPVTSRTYGKITKQFLGFSDATDNPMMISTKIHADTKEAEAEAETSDDV